MTTLPPSNSAPAWARRLNPSQQAGLDLTRHVAITAAAGSGKTTVLVERYLRILEETDASPEKIVAITFTEEAAAQMKAKIRQALEERAGGRTAAQLESATRMLAGSRITTFHGFCLALLREFPVEAGVDPAFEVLPAGQQDVFLLETVQRALQDWSKSHDDRLGTALEYLNRKSLQQLLVELTRRRNHLGPRLMDVDSEAELFRLYRQETAAALADSREVAALRTALGAVPTFLTATPGSCSTRCLQQLTLFRQRSSLTNEDFVARLSVTLEGRVQPGNQWKEATCYADLLEAWDALRRLFRGVPLRLSSASRSQDNHFRTAVTAIQDLYREVVELFQNQKRSSRFVDFDDLLHFSVILLERQPAVVRILRGRFSHFLIDEFQDTNQLQWRLVKPLIGPENNFLVVGDSKQSIYRFRDADVSVFSEVQRWLSVRGRLVEMPENYRSDPAIVGFCNRLFKSLFRARFPYEAAHQEMLPQRLSDPTGLVKTLFYGNLETGEPDLVAVCIRRLIESGRSPGEIALLLRTRTRLKAYEAALERHGVSYQTISGSGFYQRQEVLDLASLAKFVSDPGDSIALVGVLRSPLFNLSDEELYLISQEAGENFWARLQAWPGGALVSRRLKHWLDQHRWQRIAEFFHDVFSSTGYLHTLSEGQRGTRNLANVGKFLELAREFERSQPRTLAAFCGFLDSLIEGRANEEEAAPAQAQGEAISIYTIHGAKGLQFPVVVIPDLGVPFAASPTDRFSHLAIPRRGQAGAFFGLKLRNPDENYRELEHPLYQALSRLEQYRQMAEEKRLLYVALTRAQDQLYLIGQLSERPSAVRWIADAVGKDFEVPDEEVVRWLEAPDTVRVGNWQADFPNHRPLLAKSLEPASKVIWSPTEIAEFVQCPRSFYLKHVEAELDRGLQAQPLGSPGVQLGAAVHRLLEFAHRLADRRSLESRVATEAHRLALSTDADQQRIEDRLWRHIDGYLNSELRASISRSRQFFSERPFRLASAGVEIHGVIDTLFEDSHGGWTVVDFKTSSQTGLGQRPAEQALYRTQLQIYLWAVSELIAGVQPEGVLFFTDAGTSDSLEFDSALAERCQAWIEALPANEDRKHYPRNGTRAKCNSCPFLEQQLCSGSDLAALDSGPEFREADDRYSLRS